MYCISKKTISLMFNSTLLLLSLYGISVKADGQYCWFDGVNSRCDTAIYDNSCGLFIDYGSQSFVINWPGFDRIHIPLNELLVERITEMQASSTILQFVSQLEESKLPEIVMGALLAHHDGSSKAYDTFLDTLNSVLFNIYNDHPVIKNQSMHLTNALLDSTCSNDDLDCSRLVEYKAIGKEKIQKIMHEKLVDNLTKLSLYPLGVQKLKIWEPMKMQSM